MKTRVAFAVALAALAFAASAVRAVVPEPVKTDAGLVSGTDASAPGVRVFKGIPFAAPPIGELRWRAPQPVAKWSGVRRADRFGNVCVQPKGVGRLNVSVDLPDSPPASEDCLYLNVWTAAQSATERRPVMFWIFGGAYSEGAGSSPHTDGEALARKGVVLVSFNYRLGPFGFFSHPELTKESGHHASGNQALMDAIAALRWVQSNITAFGGDPRNVTIFGESAGAAMAAGLVGSAQAAGLFRRAISESGAWMGLGIAAMRTREQAEQPAGRRGGPPPPPMSLAELRAKPADEIARTLFGAGMIADGWIITEDQSLTFAQGRQQPVDVIVGSNKDEGSFAGNTTADGWTSRVRQRWPDLADEYLKLYPAGADEEATRSAQAAFRDELAWHMRRYAAAQTGRGQHAYLYFFTHEPPYAPEARNLRATHAVEIPYVFDNLRPPRVFPDASSPELASASATERALADRVSSYWVNFARTGDPNGAGLPRWPPFTPGAAPMIIGEIAETPAAPRLAIYDTFYAKLLAGLTK
ncbi:MAG TPA: carboxylesterase family protein [Vicinamibacterales bacterium]|nr:carboxylesterase family protein [Vicinamibacterales bacterium]